MINGQFRRYDYGISKNQRKYGQSSPSSYNLGVIGIPVYYFAGSEDKFADKMDVEVLVEYRRKTQKIWVRYYNAGHCSFLWGNEMPFYVDMFDILEGR